MDNSPFRSLAHGLNDEQKEVFDQLVDDYERSDKSSEVPERLVKQRGLSVLNPPAEVLAFYRYVQETAPEEDQQRLKKLLENVGMRV